MERINITTQSFEFDDVLTIAQSIAQTAQVHEDRWVPTWKDLVEAINDLAGREEVAQIQAENPRPRRRGGRPKGSKNRVKAAVETPIGQEIDDGVAAQAEL